MSLFHCQCWGCLYTVTLSPLQLQPKAPLWPSEFTEQADKQPSAFAAVVEQSHHNTDSYITGAKSRGPLTAGADATSPPGCSITIISHSGTEHDAALSHLVAVKNLLVLFCGGKRRKVLSLQPSGLEIAEDRDNVALHQMSTSDFVSSLPTIHVTYGHKSWGMQGRLKKCKTHKITHNAWHCEPSVIQSSTVLATHDALVGCARKL